MTSAFLTDVGAGRPACPGFGRFGYLQAVRTRCFIRVPLPIRRSSSAACFRSQIDLGEQRLPVAHAGSLPLV
jgi:hypothetical protein